MGAVISVFEWPLNAPAMIMGALDVGVPEAVIMSGAYTISYVATNYALGYTFSATTDGIIWLGVGGVINMISLGLAVAIIERFITKSSKQ